MGAESIHDKDLEALNIQIIEKTESGSRKLKIPQENVSKYIELIKVKLAEGFWNEIIGSSEIIFIFKFKDGSIKEFKLTLENESQIDKLCASFNNEPLDKTTNVYKYLSENEFYHEFMLQNYSNMIKR